MVKIGIPEPKDVTIQLMTGILGPRGRSTKQPHRLGFDLDDQQASFPVWFHLASFRWNLLRYSEHRPSHLFNKEKQDK